MIIVLLGYMGSGKSSVGKELSLQKNIPFLDLDKFIEKNEKNTISGIFKEKGEVYFRMKEHQYLQKILSNENNLILALGGGTPCYAGNMDLIISNKKAVSVYLKASISTLSNRLITNKNKRPLLANLKNDEVPEFIAKHLFERSYFYQLANKKILVDGKSMDEVIVQLLQILKID